MRDLPRLAYYLLIRSHFMLWSTAPDFVNFIMFRLHWFLSCHIGDCHTFQRPHWVTLVMIYLIDCVSLDHFPNWCFTLVEIDLATFVIIEIWLLKTWNWNIDWFLSLITLNSRLIYTTWNTHLFEILLKRKVFDCSSSILFSYSLLLNRLSSTGILE